MLLIAIRRARTDRQPEALRRPAKKHKRRPKRINQRKQHAEGDQKAFQTCKSIPPGPSLSVRRAHAKVITELFTQLTEPALSRGPIGSSRRHRCWPGGQCELHAPR